jgi:SAM-dependent methyltransferase
MNAETREDFLWLMSEEAAPILEKVQAAFEERINAVRIAKSLRKNTTATRSALVMEQAQLRIRGRRKFGRANRMFFTRRGLEQASGRRLANYKVRRFEGLSTVGDICCGIGGDLIAIAKRGSKSATDATGGLKTVGVDIDELTCLFARRNLEVNSVDLSLVDLQQVDFADFDLDGCDGLHLDPDRRSKDRTVHGNRFSPSLQDIFSRVSPRCSVAIKVAPATPWTSYFPAEIQREWIGDHRECKQQMLWLGPATDKPGHRTATYVGKGGLISQISVAEIEKDQSVEVFDTIHRYVFEPHPAVLAAKLTDTLARRYGIRRFTSSIVYLTGDERIDDPLLAQFEVLDVLPLDIRKTSRILKILDVGEIEVKKRGVEDVAASQFGRLKLEGPNRATLILTRLGRNRVVIIAKRKENPLTIPTR